MFEHERVRRLLSSYHDGELSSMMTVRVEHHLDKCESCQQEYKRLSLVANAVRHLPRQQAPESLAQMLRRRINEEVKGMVPILRGELLSSRSRPILAPALSMGAVLTLSLVAGVFAFGWYQEATLKTPPVALVTTTVEPLFLEEKMTSPRIRHVDNLPYTDMASGNAGSLLTLASIDQSGEIHGLHVIDGDGDEKIQGLMLEALRASGFEPAEVGGRKVGTNFLYFFTTTEVRSGRNRSISAFGRLLATVS
jgi:hypothetical protein